MNRIQAFQVFIGIIVSIATTLIGWQTYQLSERTAETNAQLKQIEQQLAQSKFGFERIRDVYDRTEKYLSSENQNKARGRVLVVLINSLPDTYLRTELLDVVIKNAELNAVAAAAADVAAPKPTKPIVPDKDSNFTGNLSLEIDEDTLRITTKGEFSFTDSEGIKWLVPKGTTANGASIPRVYWSQFGSPLDSEYTIPLVLHEHFSNIRTRSYQDVNRMFYDALIESGLSEIKAKILYSAVAALGPRWEVQK